MKRLLSAIVILSAGMMILGGCKEKKEVDGPVIATHHVPQRHQPPIAMPADSQLVSVQWQGASYNVKVVRTSRDSVFVEDSDKQKYIDNSCRLTIMRQDGSLFTQKTFLKSTFLSYVDEPFRSGGILADIRFDEVNGKNLQFSVVVAMPDAVDDLFVPLQMNIDSQGGIGISKVDDMGMLDYDGYHEDDAF